MSEPLIEYKPKPLNRETIVGYKLKQWDVIDKINEFRAMYTNRVYCTNHTVERPMMNRPNHIYSKINSASAFVRRKHVEVDYFEDGQRINYTFPIEFTTMTIDEIEEWWKKFPERRAEAKRLRKERKKKGYLRLKARMPKILEDSNYARENSLNALNQYLACKDQALKVELNEQRNKLHARMLSQQKIYDQARNRIFQHEQLYGVTNE